MCRIFILEHGPWYFARVATEHYVAMHNNLWCRWCFMCMRFVTSLQLSHILLYNNLCCRRKIKSRKHCAMKMWHNISMFTNFLQLLLLHCVLRPYIVNIDQSLLRVLSYVTFCEISDQLTWPSWTIAREKAAKNSIQLETTGTRWQVKLQESQIMLFRQWSW